MTTVELTAMPWRGIQRAHTTHAYKRISCILVVFNDFLLVTLSCDCIPTPRTNGQSLQTLVLVTKYTQRCGELGLVHETKRYTGVQGAPR